MSSMYDVAETSFQADAPNHATCCQDAAYCINKIWNDIGSDILDCEDVESISLDEMLETCLDAGRMQEYDMVSGKFVMWMKRFQPSLWTEFVSKYFRYSTYGR